MFVQVPVEMKTIDKEAGTLEAIFSTQDVDRHGDTIIQEGWYLKAFKKNPVIINSHNYHDAAEVIGKAANVKVEKKKLQGKITFAINENPKAKIIFDLYAGGFLNAFSVGMIIDKFAENKDGSTDWWTIEEATLLEVSAVSVPANARALAKKKGIDVDALPDNENENDDTNNQDEDTDQDEESDEVSEDSEVSDTDEEEAPEEGDSGKDGSEKSEEDGSDEGDEGGDEADTGEDESEEVEEEEEEPNPKQTSYSRKVINAMASIESKEKRQLKKIADIVESMLVDTGVKRAKRTREQIRKRKVNQVIRMLLKSK